MKQIGGEHAAVFESRANHGAFGKARITREAKQIADAKGRPSAPYRVSDALDDLLAKSWINAYEYEAGRRWQDDFDLSGLGRIKTADPTRVPTSGGRGGNMTLTQLMAREAMLAALDHLGGITAPASRVLWEMIGLGKDAKTFEAEQRFADVRMVITQREARKVIVAACATLVAHYAKVDAVR